MVIAEDGWGGPSARNAARRGGVSAGLVLDHFGSVSDLPGDWRSKPRGPVGQTPLVPSGAGRSMLPTDAIRQRDQRSVNRTTAARVVIRQ
jgi:hypothetical protein